MYIKTICSHCGGNNLHEIEVNYRKTTSVLDDGVYTKIHFSNVTVKETLKEDMLIKSVLKSLQESGLLFLSKDELTDVLKRIFSISIGFVDEFAEKIQNENEVREADLKSNMKAVKKTSKGHVSKN